jgi:hypothetical protein
VTAFVRALLAAAFVVLGVGLAAPAALADNLGSLVFVPPTGTDITGIHVHTPVGCPQGSNAYYMSIKGAGFPARGQIVTENTAANFSRVRGFDAYFFEVMRDYRKDNAASKLKGPYVATLYCIDGVSQKVFGTMSGTFVFTTPTTYRALGASAGVPTSSAAPGTGSASGSNKPPGSSAAPTAQPPTPNASVSPLGAAPLSSGTPDPSNAAATAASRSTPARNAVVGGLVGLAVVVAGGIWLFLRQKGSHEA